METFWWLPVFGVGVFDHGNAAAIWVATIQIEPTAAGHGVAIQEIIGVNFWPFAQSAMIGMPASGGIAGGAKDRGRAMQTDVGIANERAAQLHVFRIVNQLPQHLGLFSEGEVIFTAGGSDGAIRINEAIDFCFQALHVVRGDDLTGDAIAVGVEGAADAFVVVLIEVDIVIHG